MENGSIHCWGRSESETVVPSGRFDQFVRNCGLRPDGTVECWAHQPGLTDLRIPPRYFTQIAGGQGRLCGLRPDGSAEGCGYGDVGSLQPHHGPFVSIMAFGDLNCGFTPDSTLACWGGAEFTTLPEEGQFVEVAYGRDALDAEGSIHCWGYVPGAPPAQFTGAFTQVIANAEQRCGLNSDGVIDCIGLESRRSTYRPEIELTKVGVARDLICGLDRNGIAHCWGAAVDASAWPTPAGAFSQVSVGYDEREVCGLRDDGIAVCWGVSFLRVPIPPGPYEQISVGYYYACGVRADGLIGCWGRRPPTDIADERAPGPQIVTERADGPFVQVEVGRDQACALRASGSVVCWEYAQCRSHMGVGRSRTGRRTPGVGDSELQLPSDIQRRG